MTHELKIRKQWADAKLAGEKPFEIRMNDRGFQKGDTVRYRVVDPKTGEPWTPKDGKAPHPLETMRFRVTYVLQGFAGLSDGYCVFADTPSPPDVRKSPDGWTNPMAGTLWAEIARSGGGME